jgi:Zn-dependent protease with chaperone function
VNRSAVAVVAIIVALVPTPARAQPSRRGAPQEQAIEQELAAVAPAAVAPFRRATEAMDAGRHADGTRLFRDVLRAAPDFTPALRRLGFCLHGAGDREQALSYLRRAVALQHSPENLVSLASVLGATANGAAAPRNQQEQALALAKEATVLNRNARDPGYLIQTAVLALSLPDEQEFVAAADELARRFPEQPHTHYFAAIRAAAASQWERAEAEIREAERLGLPHEAAEAFLASGVHTRASAWRYARYIGYLVAAWAVGLLMIFVAGRALSAATLTSINRADANELASPSELVLRSRYRMLVQCAGIYYYVSQPFVIVLVLGGSAAVIYGFLLLGRLPIKLVIVLGLAALVTTFKMVQSLLVKVSARDPGRRLEEHEAPGLWALARDVAATVNTRPIDEIRITPGTEMAVYERGTASDRRHDRAHRILIVGTGLLHGFRQDAFRAVLAHEYGHFAHRDTAGGDVALRVQQDMMRFAFALMQQGQAVWWNLAFQFLRVYNFLFRRITHGATRLQEVLADRMAAHAYGPAQFEEGLRHVIRRSVEFDAAIAKEIQEAVHTRRAMANLYDLPAPSGPELEATIEEALARPTTDDDTHPGPMDRFRLVGLVNYTGTPTPMGMVWDLFAAPEQLMAEMTRDIAGRVQEQFEGVSAA